MSKPIEMLKGNEQLLLSLIKNPPSVLGSTTNSINQDEAATTKELVQPIHDLPHIAAHSHDMEENAKQKKFLKHSQR